MGTGLPTGIPVTSSKGKIEYDPVTGVVTYTAIPPARVDLRENGGLQFVALAENSVATQAILAPDNLTLTFADHTVRNIPLVDFTISKAVLSALHSEFRSQRTQ